MRFPVIVFVLAAAAAGSPADDYVVWTGAKGEKGVEWKKSVKSFGTEDEAYASAAKPAKDVIETRVLLGSRVAPKADSPIIAGRTAKQPVINGGGGQEFKFNNNGTGVDSFGRAVFRYTVDGFDVVKRFDAFKPDYADFFYKISDDGLELYKGWNRESRNWQTFKGEGLKYTFTTK